MQSVLMVEDDPIVQLHGIEVLHSIGFERNKIFTAAGGHDGIHFLNAYFTKHNRLPDVILLDLHMTDGDGFEFLKASRSFANIIDVDIIIVSDSIDPNDIERAAKYKVFRYTTKPLRPEILINLLHLNDSKDQQIIRITL